jgi:hypothetical protein
MGLIETLIKKLTPEKATPRVSTPTSRVPTQYPQEVLRMVAATWTTGMAHFAGERLQLGLAEMFCGAVSERLFDEIDGVTRPSSELLHDLLKEARAPVPAQQAFANLGPSGFDTSYARLRLEYANQGADLEQMATALVHVVDIMRYVSHIS